MRRHHPQHPARITEARGLRGAPGPHNERAYHRVRAQGLASAANGGVHLGSDSAPLAPLALHGGWLAGAPATPCAPPVSPPAASPTGQNLPTNGKRLGHPPPCGVPVAVRFGRARGAESDHSGSPRTPPFAAPARPSTRLGTTGSTQPRVVFSPFKIGSVRGFLLLLAPSGSNRNYQDHREHSAEGRILPL